MSLHAPQPTVQEGFEATICSPHAREGRLLARWVDAFEHRKLRASQCDGRTFEAPSPLVVLDFVEYLSRLVVAQHSLQKCLQQVNVCTARLLLSTVQPALWMMVTERNQHRDSQMLGKQRWMRTLPPSQLGVETRFLSSGDGATDESPPPLMAASVLADFCFLSVPVDMLLCLYRAVGLVHKAAAEAANLPPSVIGADSLLPLLVWTVAHTPLPHIFSALEYAKLLSTREQITSELGYYLACLEAACEYVLDSQHGGAPSDHGNGPQTCPAPASESAPPWHTLQSQARPHEFTNSTQCSDGAASSAQRVAEGRANEIASREALVDFLQQERVVDDLVEALVL